MHYRRACAHDQGPARACVGVLRKACRDRPPWALCRDREGSPSVAIETLVSRQGWLFGVMTQPWCHNKCAPSTR